MKKKEEKEMEMEMEMKKMSGNKGKESRESKQIGIRRLTKRSMV